MKKLNSYMTLLLEITCLYLNNLLLTNIPTPKPLNNIPNEWLLCPKYYDGINCMNPKCINCEYTCTNKCLEDALGEINTHYKCAISITFVDVTKDVLKLKYFNKYPHLGRPKNSEYSPLFVDLDDDGVYDVLDFSHQEVKEVLLSYLEKNITSLHPIKDRIIIEDKNASKIDTHGINVLDLDNDGIVDIYISVGGGRGGLDALYSAKHNAKHYITRNILLWGEDITDQNILSRGTWGEKHTKNIIFRGGQKAASKAGIDMMSTRGRMNYILDVNNDGLYDIFSASDRRVDNLLTPGVLLINNGNRTWRKESSLMEYSKVMILTDVDGDGYANELVINRDFCLPQRDGPDIDPTYPNFGPFPHDILIFCSTRPASTTAVYKYDTQTQRMNNIAKLYSNISAYKYKQPPCCPHGSYYGHCCVQSMASADFDGDLIADQVFLYMHKIKLFYSSDRPKGALPFGRQYLSDTIYIPKECYVPKAVRVIDIDNDGLEEILVMCRRKASSQVIFYSRVNPLNIKAGWFLNTNCAFGDLNNLIELAEITEEDYKAACKNVHQYNINKRVCHQYRKKVSYKLFVEGLSIVDMNNDGYYDMVFTFALGKTVFLYNKPLKMNKFIAFKVKGKANLHGIGATLILYAKNDEGLTTQFREISSYQHASDNQGYIDDRIIFGLGKDGIPIKLIVRWPDRHSQIVTLDDWVYTPKFDIVEIVED